jgi:hypothetical protein
MVDMARGIRARIAARILTTVGIGTIPLTGGAQLVTVFLPTPDSIATIPIVPIISSEGELTRASSVAGAATCTRMPATQIMASMVMTSIKTVLIN